MSSDHDPQPRAAPGGLRARNHAARRQAFLDAARWIVATDGIDALTMQRLATELESGVGSIYRYFPSKDALVAAVVDEQLRTLHDAIVDGRDRFDGGRTGDDDGTAARVRALARAVLIGRLWVEAAGVLRPELTTARRLVGTMAEAPERIDAIVGVLREPFDAAVAAGVLVPDDNEARVRVLMAAVGDAVLTTDGPHFGFQLLDCLLGAWGAEADELERAGAVLAGVES